MTKSVYPIAVMAVLVFVCTAVAQNTLPATLDIRQAVSDLATASKQADEAVVPVESLDKIKTWDGLLDTSLKIKAAVDAAIQNTDAAIASFKAKAEKYQKEPAKAEVFKKRIDDLQGQADTFTLLNGSLGKAIATLKAKLEKIKADPDVKQALEAQSIAEKVDAAIQNSSEAVPAFLKE